MKHKLQQTKTGYLDHLASWLVTRRKRILVFCLILAIFSAIKLPQVKVDYNLAHYVPSEAASTLALERVKQGSVSLPNAQVMVKDVSITEALNYKSKLSKVAHVGKVFWLDDQVDLKTPLEIASPSVVEAFYKDKNALFYLTIDEGGEVKDADAVDLVKIVASLREVVGEKGAVSGQVVELASAKSAVQSEMLTILLFMVPLVLIILWISTTSWLEPLLFIGTIFVAVLYNMGTNFIFPKVSFVTQSVTATLQLAVTLDYMIFLLHAFQKHKQSGGIPNQEAMILAVKDSFSSITASALTTFFGFLALVFMRFKIGSDLGLVLAKGILFSLFTVVAMLPALVLALDPLLEKTRHRTLVPQIRFLPKLVRKITPIVVAISLLVAIPAFWAHEQTDFRYGMGAFPKESREERDLNEIRSTFGSKYTMILLLPKGQLAAEQELVAELNKMPQVDSIRGYVTEVGSSIPADFLTDAQREQIYTQDFSRYILQIDSPRESAETFALVKEIREVIAKHFVLANKDLNTAEVAYLAGENASLYDLKETVNQDSIIVNGLAILAVGLVILLAFRKLMAPLVLLFTIELAIWINLSIPYLTHTHLSYIGYLIISTVQLGATVDYAILLTRYYSEYRKQYSKSHALEKTIENCALSVITPALILAVAGFILGQISTISIVSELGRILASGALITLLLVLFLLPGLWLISDRFLCKNRLEKE